MKLTDPFNKCPVCGGTLQYELFDVTEEDNGISRMVEMQRIYSCNVCQVEGDWRRTREGAIESMAAKVREAV